MPGYSRAGLALLALITLSAPAGAEIYKCRLADGNTEISNLPCPQGSATLTSRPDERVSDSARRQAEREVERMRQYVERREAAQRNEEANAREEKASSQRQPSTVSHSPAAHRYGSVEECLLAIEPQALEASQRAEMEANCHAITPPPNVYVPAVIPAYPQPPSHAQPHQPPPTKIEKPDAPSIPIYPLQK